MKSIILCEGKDDLWFIAYYLHKCAGWNIDSKATCWRNAKIPVYDKQNVKYLLCPHSKDTTAIVSVGGQTRMRDKLSEIAHLNNAYPHDPIQSIVLFRDCDDCDPEDVANSMGEWFSPALVLHNGSITTYCLDIDEIKVNVQVLPVVIPFDEDGAIETLLLKSIEDSSTDGAYVACHAREYIDEANQIVTQYLKNSRLVTKAKYSAAVAITNPDHSTALFKDLMMATNWEESCSVRKHFSCVLDTITEI